jgi:uncharacterized protein YacL
VLFRRDRTYILDFSTLADERIANLLQFGLIQGKFLAADPSSWEVKTEQKSKEKSETTHLVKRAEDCIARLKKIKGIKVKTLKGLNDPKNFLGIARQNKASVLTVNPELKKTLTNIPVVLLNELYDSLKPAYLPGSEIIVKVLKKGKTPDEGIGYMDGGVKVVIDNGAQYVGKDVSVVVMGSLDTSVGRLIFAQPKYTEVR